MGELDIRLLLRLLRDEPDPDPMPELLLEMYRRRVPARSPAILCPICAQTRTGPINAPSDRRYLSAAPRCKALRLLGLLDCSEGKTGRDGEI